MGLFLEVEPARFADALNMECERGRGGEAGCGNTRKTRNVKHTGLSLQGMCRPLSPSEAWDWMQLKACKVRLESLRIFTPDFPSLGLYL